MKIEKNIPPPTERKRRARTHIAWQMVPGDSVLVSSYVRAYYFKKVFDAKGYGFVTASQGPGAGVRVWCVGKEKE